MPPGGIILLSTAYLGPVQYFTKFLPDKQVRIEKHENYIKQTYRNRCIIAGPNGPQSLQVPVKRGSFHKVPVKELEIEYGKPWQKLHWRSVTAAYNNSPYFQYYRNAMLPVFLKQPRFLIDLNTELTEILLQETGIPQTPVYTDDFIPRGSNENIDDFRYRILPKNSPADPQFFPHTYRQVFSDRHGFIPNLSLIDALFNLGPETGEYLRNCLRREDQ